MRVFLFTDGSLEGDGRLRNFPSMADFFDADVHAAGQFFAGRLAAKFLYKLPGMPGELVDDLDHVDRYADLSRLVGNCRSDGLPNPSGRIGREFISASPVELIRAFHQAQIPFLDEIEKLQAMMGIFFGDRDHQAKVGRGEFLLGLLGVGFATLNNAERAFERDQTAVTRQCHSAQRDARATKLSARLGGDWVCQTPQAANLAFQSLEALDEGPEVVHEALAFVPMERNLADGERNVDARAGQRPLAANVGLLLRFWRSGEFLCLAEGGFME